MADTVEKHTVEYNVASAVRAADALSKALLDQAAAMELVNNAARQLKSSELASSFATAKRAVDLLNKLDKDFTKSSAQEQNARIQNKKRTAKAELGIEAAMFKEQLNMMKAESRELAKIEKAQMGERLANAKEQVKQVSNFATGIAKAGEAGLALQTKQVSNFATGIAKAGEAGLALQAKQVSNFATGIAKAGEAGLALQTKQVSNFATGIAKAGEAGLALQTKQVSNFATGIAKAGEAALSRQTRIGESFAAVGQRAIETRTKFEKAELAKREKAVVSSLKNQERALSNFKSKASKLNPFGALTASADTFSGALQAIVTYGVINRITNELTASVTRAADLQVKIAEIQTLSQKLGQDGQSYGTFRSDEAVRKDIARLSNATALDQLDVAAAAYEAISNQVEGAAENFDFLGDAAKFALGAVSSLNDASQLLSATLNSYNLAATRAEEVSAKWFRAIDLGRFTVADIALDIGRSAVLANDLGISLDELAAAYSTMTIQGVKFANAQTFLTNIMLKLIKPTEEMKGIFTEWGVTSGAAAVEIFGINGVLRKLDEVAKRSGDSLGELGEQFSTIRAIVGATILGNNADLFDKNLKEISQAQDAFNTAFEIRITNSGQIVKQELKQIENFFTNELGDSVVKTLANFSGGTQDISEGFEYLFELLTKGIPTLVAFKTAFNITESVRAAILALASYRAAATTAAAATTLLGTTATVASVALTGGLALIPIAISAAVGYMTYQGVQGLQLFGTEGEKAFEKINEAADKFLKDFKTRSIIEFQKTADEVTNSFDFISKSLALLQVKRLAEINRTIKGIISGSEVFQDALSRAFAASAIELNKQVFLLKDFNNIIDDTQREIDNLATDFKEFSAELVKDFKVVNKIVEDAAKSVADFRKEVALSQKAPGSITETVVAARFQDEIAKFEEIADVRERVKALLKASDNKQREGLTLFNNGKIEEGNNKTQEAIALLGRTKELLAELKKSEPESALGLPSVEEITKRLEFFDKQIEKRRAATEVPKVFGLINESNIQSQEAFNALSSGELEKAETFFKESQSLFKEASKLADSLRDSGIKVPLTNEFVNAFQARTQEFANASDEIRAEIVRTQAEGLRKTASDQLAQMFSAQQQLGEMAKDVSEKFTDNKFSDKIQEEISGISKVASNLAFEFESLVDALARGIVDPEEADKRFETLQRRLKDVNDDIKSSNEKVNNENREALDLQSKQEQTLTKIADRYREIERAAAEGGEDAIKRIRDLEAANVADLNSLKDTGLKMTDAAKTAVIDFTNQIALNLEDSGLKLEGFIQELEGLSKDASNFDIRGTISAAIEDPAKLKELSDLFDELRKSGSSSENKVIDNIMNAMNEYSGTLNTFNNVQSNLTDLAEGRLDVETQLVSTTGVLIEALQERILLEKQQNDVLASSDELRKINSELETTKGAINTSIGDFSKGVQRATAAIQSSIKDQLISQGFRGTDEQVEAVLSNQRVVESSTTDYNSLGVVGTVKGKDRVFNPSNLAGLNDLLLSLQDLSNRVETGAVTQDELNAVLPQAKEQFLALSRAINENLNVPDLSTIGSLADSLLGQAKATGVLGKPEVLDESLKRLFNEASPAADRKAAADALAKQLSVIANAKGTDDQLEVKLLEFAATVEEVSKKLELTVKDNSNFQEVLGDINKAIITLEGDKSVGRAPLSNLIGNEAKIQTTLEEESERLKTVLKELGLSDTQIAGITKDSVQLDKTRNDLLTSISSNTDGLSPTLNFIVGRLSKLKTETGEPFFDVPPLERAIGGRIPRRGTDSVMTALTPGEFVIRKSVADKIGTSSLHMLNNGVVPQTLASGGFVDNNLKNIFRELKEQGRRLFAAELDKIGMELEKINTSTIDAKNRIFEVGAYSAKSKGFGSSIPTGGSFNARKVFKLPGASSGLPIGSTGIDLTPRLLAENKRLEVAAKADKLKAIGERLYREQAGALGYSVESVSSSVDTATGAFRVLSSVLKSKFSAAIGGFDNSLPSTRDVPKKFDLRRYLATLAVGGFVPNRKDISGLGTDSVLAALTPGEFVIKAASAKKLGPDFLKGLNGYANGGQVGGGLNLEELMEYLATSGGPKFNYLGGRGTGLEKLLSYLQNNNFSRRVKPNMLNGEVVSNQFFGTQRPNSDYLYQQFSEADSQSARGRLRGTGGSGSRLGAAPSSMFTEDEYIRLFGMRRFNSSYYADGGPVGPKGTDTVNAWLTPGEFVINKKSTEMFGPLLDVINRAGIGSSTLNKVIGPYFAEGGLIPSVGYKGVSFDPRESGNTYVSNENQFSLNSTGSEPIDASRLVYFINKQQRTGAAQLNSRRSRAY